MFRCSGVQVKKPALAEKSAPVRGENPKDHAIAALRSIPVKVDTDFAFGAAAYETFLANFRYACALAVSHEFTIQIEPLNHYDAPGYFLTTTDQTCKYLEFFQTLSANALLASYRAMLILCLGFTAGSLKASGEATSQWRHNA